MLTMNLIKYLTYIVDIATNTLPLWPPLPSPLMASMLTWWVTLELSSIEPAGDLYGPDE
jgi:hypothetical protein